MKFVPLRIRSGYTFLQSGFTMEKLFAHLKKGNFTSAGLADFGVLYGAPSFFSYAQKHLIQPILGLEVPVVYHTYTFSIHLYVENENGYRYIMRLSSLLSQNEAIAIQQITAQKGIICVIDLTHPILLEHVAIEDIDLRKLLQYLSVQFTHFYIGASAYEKEDITSLETIRSFSHKYGYSVVAFPLIAYPKKEEAITLRIVKAIEQEEHLEIDQESGPYYLPSLSSLTSLYREEEINNTAEIASFCSLFNWSTKRGHMLSYTKAKNSKIELKEQAMKGLEKYHLQNQQYLDRLNYELEVIDQMGYSDYFLIVADYVHYAKTHDIPVGPGRGSAASSLVSFALNITTIDPIRYQLLFESFLNPARISMPDIDIDFGDIKRDMVVAYLRNHYGKNRVANIVTFQTIGAKQSLRDIGRVYQFPTHDIDLLAKSIPDNRFSLRSAYQHVLAFRQLVDSDPYFLKIVQLAAKIEGLPRQAGLHAAGVVLNEEPLEDVLPVTIDADGNYTSQYEMNPLAEQGFLKMDILGLRNLSILEDCIERVNRYYGTNYSQETLPYEEKEIFDLIASTKTMGLFQLESNGIKRAIQLLEPECFEDIVAVLALFRPGPINNIPIYARRKKNHEEISYFHPCLKDILSSTYGIIVYQEQVLQVVVRIAGFSLSKADLFRRAISKKDANKLAVMEKEFMEGAIQNGFDATIAKNIYQHILRFADYGFKRAHSVAYAKLSCQMGYMKVHYPAMFYAAILESASVTNDNKFLEYVSEIKKMGLRLLLPNVQESTHQFVAKENALLLPLTAIKGIPYSLCTSIVQEREKKPFRDFFDFVIRLVAYKMTTLHLSRLIDSGALDCFGYTRTSLHRIQDATMQYANLMGYSYQSETLNESILPPPMIEEVPDDPIEKLLLESEALGFMLSETPLKYQRSILQKNGIHTILEAKKFANVQFAGYLKSIKTIKTKKGEPMAFITLFDDEAEQEIVVFPKLYADCFLKLKKNTILIVKGKQEKNGSFIADLITSWEDENNG